MIKLRSTKRLQLVVQQTSFQALSSMSLNPPIQDIRNFQYPDGSIPSWLKSEEIKDKSGNPVIYGNDVDSVDVATR